MQNNLLSSKKTGKIKFCVYYKFLSVAYSLKSEELYYGLVLILLKFLVNYWILKFSLYIEGICTQFIYYFLKQLLCHLRALQILGNTNLSHRRKLITLFYTIFKQWSFEILSNHFLNYLVTNVIAFIRHLISCNYLHICVICGV